MNRQMANYGAGAVESASQALKENKYLRMSALVVGGLVVGGLLFFGYSKYKKSRESAAQYDLAQGLREYAQAFDRTTMWPEVEQLFKAGYERNKNSDLAPYFLFFQADALLAQDKKEEALELFDAGLRDVGASSPLYSPYATKGALLAIDLGKERGIEQLTALAHDESNVQRDAPLYYLGLYYWSNNDIERAQQEWQTLVSLKKPDQKVVSEWIVLAQKKLEQIA